MSGPGKQKSTISPAWLTGEGATDGSSNAISNNGNGAHAGASSTGSVKNEITQVKTEATKPKFVPKVPVKKEAIVVPATSRYALLLFVQLELYSVRFFVF